MNLADTARRIGWPLATASLAVVLALAACDGDRRDAGPRQLDLIFVIENAGSMHEPQENLQRGFPALVARLAQAPGGMPDTRIAIVSSDFGAGAGTYAVGCPGRGDGGRFQVRGGCGLEDSSTYLFIDAAGNRNFKGELADAFACLAALGVDGCAYEHQLQSLRTALAASDPSSDIAPGNRGFLRREAVLGIVFLSNEDDCSAEVDATLYQQPIEGQGGSLRCALLGHICNGRPVAARQDFREPLASCAPYRPQASERTSRLVDVQEFVDSVKALKSGAEDRIVVAAIVGWDAGPDAVYALVGRPGVSGGIDLYSAPICADSTGSADPAIRLVGFTRGFRHHLVHPVCDPNLMPPMRQLADEITGALQRPTRR
jgi:hypothetical protein